MAMMIEGRNPWATLNSGQQGQSAGQGVYGSSGGIFNPGYVNNSLGMNTGQQSTPDNPYPSQPNGFDRTFYGAAPWNLFDDPKRYFGSQVDPFNITGWDKPKPVNTAGPQPMYPDYQGPSHLDDSFHSHANAPDQGVLNNLRNRAMSDGPSPYMQAALQKQGLDESFAKQDALAMGRSNAQQMRDDYAMQGGLTSGAAERANMFAMNNAQDNAQKIGRQGMSDRLSLAMDDDTKKLSTLQNLPGIQNTAYNPMMQSEQFNIGNDINEGARRNAFNLQRYDSMMKAWGAAKSADATYNASSQKSGMGK